MGCGFSACLKKYRREESGDGINGYEVNAGDERWVLSQYFPWDDDDEKTQKIDVNKLWEEWKKEQATYNCECGAKATANWNCHSFWCPAYRPMS